MAVKTKEPVAQAKLVHKTNLPAGIARTNKSGAPTIKIVHSDPQAWLASLKVIAKLVVYGNPTTSPAVVDRLKNKLRSHDGLLRKQKIYDILLTAEVRRLSKMHPYKGYDDAGQIAEWRKEKLID